MCLSLPVKVEEINGNKARVIFGGNEYCADIRFLEDVSPGEYILLHAGFGIQKISEQHALETVEIIEEINETALK
jgi:hydrogenase expression/formation protein HypC